MKTTLNIDDTVMAELKREAARQGRTMSDLVESALRLLLRSQRQRRKIRKDRPRTKRTEKQGKPKEVTGEFHAKR